MASGPTSWLRARRRNNSSLIAAMTSKSSSATRVARLAQEEAPIGRKPGARDATEQEAGRFVEMPLCLEFLERLRVPLVGDHVGVVGHEFLEAVELGVFEG